MKWVSIVTQRILRRLFNGATSSPIRSATLDFWGAMASCSQFTHLNKVVESCCSCLSFHDSGSRGQQCEVVSIGYHVMGGDGTVRHKVVEKGWGDDGSNPSKEVVLLCPASIYIQTEVKHKQETISLWSTF